MKNNLTELKQKIYAHYLYQVNSKVQMLQQVLAELKESGANETKSTAGDKHETALAMLQIEQENKRAQLRELLNQRSILEKIDPAVVASRVVNGSLIQTNRGWFFMSIAGGKTVIDEISIIALSASSPLGQKMMGLEINDTASVNHIEYVIESIR
jgi:hypothetical protein